MNHFVLDGGCPFFEWQDTYAANLGHHQQVAQGVHLVPPASQQHQSEAAAIDDHAIQLRPTQGAPSAVQVLQGHPVQAASPAATVEAVDQEAPVAPPPGPVLRRPQPSASEAPPFPQQSAPLTSGSPDMALISMFVCH